MNDYKKVKNILIAIFVLNLLVAFLKIIVGNYIQSHSVSADGLHSLSDTASNIIGIIGVVVASKPCDKDHPYGHKKFEVLSSLFIGIMLLFIAGKIIIESILQINSQESLNLTVESFIVLSLTLIINIIVSKYEYKAGKKLDSYILISDSLHTKSDILISVGVLITLALVKLGAPLIIDKIISFVVATFILYTALNIFKMTISVLVDKSIIEEKEIKDAVEDFDEIKEIHKIRSRGCENEIYIDMHIMVDPDMTVEASHELEHNIEKKIQKSINPNIQAIVHIEPYYKG